MKNIFLISLVTAFTAVSCSFLDIEPKVISGETFYKSEKEVKYGLAGVYGAMSSEELYGNYYSLMLSGVDDLCYFNRPTTQSYSQVYKQDASSGEVYAAWTQLYAGIRNANAFMAAVKDSDNDKTHVYYNEAMFLRAYYHFLLAQAWGDVPLRDFPVTNRDNVMCKGSTQYDVLDWSAKQMEVSLPYLADTVAVEPSRVSRATAEGVLARVYLFMAGASVNGGNKADFYKKAMDHAWNVISAKKHKLNPNYSQVFINMIEDAYDTENHESMWEVEFLGDRSSASSWSNGRIGDVIGLQSSGSTKYDTFNCNYAYGQYDGSLKLFDLYWATDRTPDENEAAIITDRRQEWNMCPYNYAGGNNPPYGSDGSDGKTTCKASIDKTPYAYNGVTTTQNPLAAPAIRNCGKFRREVIYEGVKNSKMLYTTINFPLLRYSDVLLMYAEASNEYEGLTQAAYDCVKEVRERAGIKTADFTTFDQSSFRELVRNERGRELCFESLRKYDLIRWGIFVEQMHKYGEWTADDRWNKNDKSKYAANIGAAVQARHVLQPIPAIELGVNTLLVQNSLW